MDIDASNTIILKEAWCRTCLNELDQDEFHTINETFTETLTITSVLNLFNSELMVTWPEVSEKICDSCYLKLSSFGEFIQNFLNVENLLKDALVNLNNSNVETIELTKTNDAQNSSNGIDEDSMAFVKLDITKTCLPDEDKIKTELNPNVDSNNEFVYMPSKNHRVISFQNSDNLLDDLAQEDVRLLQLVDLNTWEPSDGPKRVLLFGDIIPRCTDCGKIFSHISLLKDHYSKIHQKEYILSLRNNFTNIVCTPEDLASKGMPCQHCDEIFINSKHLVEHVRADHQNGYCFKCQYCDKSFTSYYRLKDHESKFKEYESCTKKKCKHCDEILEPSEMVIHARTHKSYPCKRCDLSFINDNMRQKHNRTTHFKNVKRPAATGSNLCFICGKTFSKPHLLRQHISGVHYKKEESRKYYCDQCPNVYNRSSILWKHHQMVHQDRRAPVECETCGKILYGQIALKDHQKLKHPKESDILFKCAICDKEFVRNDYYKRHMGHHAESTIRGYARNRKKYKSVSEPVVCNICDKTYANIYYLKMHLNTHLTVRKRYQCRHCPLTFANPPSRKKHEVKHKDPSFENSCRICHKNLSSQEELAKHMEFIHTNLKYECDWCGKQFPSKYLLNSHSYEHTDVSEVDKEKRNIVREALKPYLIEF